MWRTLIPLFAALCLCSASGEAFAQEPTATPAASDTATATPTIIVGAPAPAEAPPPPTNLRLFILGSYARLEWEFEPRPNESPAQGFNLRALYASVPGPTYVVGGDVRAFDFPSEYLPRCGGPRLAFGVAAFVTAGVSDYVDVEAELACVESVEDLAPAPRSSSLQPPDAGAGMRQEDWTAVTVIASIALVGLLCIALGMSVLNKEGSPHR